MFIFIHITTLSFNIKKDKGQLNNVDNFYSFLFLKNKNQDLKWSNLG